MKTGEKEDKNNQLMRCCNIFPTYFKNISEMTLYLAHLKKAGINVVWINPIQLAGSESMKKSNAITGNAENVIRSLYAMDSTKFIDPRFSVVEKDEDGDMIFLSEHRSKLGILESKKFQKTIADTKEKRESIKIHLEKIKNQDSLLKKMDEEIEDEKAIIKKELKEKEYFLPAKDKEDSIIISLNQIAGEQDEIKKEFRGAKGNKELLGNLKKAMEKLGAQQKKIKAKIKEKINTKPEIIKLMQKRAVIIQEKNILDEGLMVLEKSRDDLLLKQREYAHELDRLAIKEFTEKAIDLEITPIFDLVLNHVAKGSPCIKEHPEWFSEDNTYLDAKAFIYSDLLNSTQLNEEKIDTIKKSIDTIIKNFWKPFIESYINEYGFCGARVDCIRKVPKEVREPIYKIIHDLVKERRNLVDEGGKALPSVIFEEALFSDCGPEEFVNRVGGAGGTHITGSVYYAEKMWHGGLPKNFNIEDFYKRKMASVGVVNFTGNHDHFSCAMTVCREWALKRLQGNTELYNAYQSKIEERIKLGKPLSNAMKEIRESIFTFSYVQEIINELNDINNKETIVQFVRDYREKLVTNMFAGSAGYYMLSGDEFAALEQPTVFLRPNEGAIYPQVTLAILEKSAENSGLAEEVIEEMASYRIKADKSIDADFKKLSDENKSRLQAPFVAQIKNEINAGLEDPKKLFLKKMIEKGKKRAEENKKPTEGKKSQSNKAGQARKGKLSDLPDYIVLENEAKEYFGNKIKESIPCAREFSNRWGQPEGLKEFINIDFFKSLNQIFDQLPLPTTEYWSALFLDESHNFFTIVKRNGRDYLDNQTDVIMINLNPSITLDLTYGDMKKFAIDFQSRQGKPINSAHYHESYGCIMGLKEQSSATLHFAGKITIDPKILKHFKVAIPKNAKGSVSDNSVRRGKPLTLLYELKSSSSSSEKGKDNDQKNISSLPKP